MFGSVLLPIDLEELDIAEKAVKAARHVATGPAPKFRLLNVLNLWPTGYSEYMPTDFEDARTDIALNKLREIAESYGLPLAQVSTKVRLGHVYPEILAEAKEWRADIIVIGSHRPAMSTYLLGSNAKTIVRHADCSVLVVRE